MKERGELHNEEGDAVREYRAVHEENFWSSELREDERSKEESTARAEKNEEERGEKGKEQRRKKRTKSSKENVRVGSLWRLLKSLVKGESWIVMVICLRTCLIVSLFLVRMCVWCLMCLVCLFPLLLLSLSFVMVSPVARNGNL